MCYLFNYRRMLTVTGKKGGATSATYQAALRKQNKVCLKIPYRGTCIQYGKDWTNNLNNQFILFIIYGPPPFKNSLIKTFISLKEKKY